MGLLATKRSVMTLFSRPSCVHSHRVRMVLKEKGITCEIENLEGEILPEDLLQLNPDNSAPTLLDRDLVLYEPRLLMEYLDERFPHPPLMPVDPVSRANKRLALHRIEKDWYSLVDELEAKGDRKQSKARKQLRESIIASNEIFAAMPFFLSDELSLVDCSIAPVLWRLEHWGIDLPKEAKDVIAYANRVFSREGFAESLSEAEIEMRPSASA